MVVAFHNFTWILVVPDYLIRNLGRKMKTHAKKVVFAVLGNTLTMFLCIESALRMFFHIILLGIVIEIRCIEAIFLIELFDLLITYLLSIG